MNTLQRWVVTVTAAGSIGTGAHAAPLSAQATIGGEWRVDVAAFAESLVEAGLAPGLGVAVASGDWVVYESGFGVADRASARRVSPDTPFYIASSTKSLTALAASIAADRGDLDLDSPMVRYLPTAELPEGVDREAIRVRDLIELTHGLSSSGPIVIRTAYTGQFDRDELPSLLRYHPPTGNAGQFEYNNLGINLLAMVLESIYGESWKEIVAREVTRPIGMHSTRAHVTGYGPDRLALPHEADPLGGFRRIALGKADANLHAAGGHFATAGDLARYLAVHISGGRAEGVEVLPPNPVRATHVQRVEQDRSFGPFLRHGWGYGWDIGTYNGDTLVHRFGSFTGYRSHMSFMPGFELGVAVLTNGSGPASPAADLLAVYIYDRLRGRANEAAYAARRAELVEQAAASRQAAATHLAERAARLAALPHPLEAYAGTYEDAALGRITFRPLAGGLEARMGVVHSRAEVFDAEANQLRIEIGGGMVVTFDFTGDGSRARAIQLAGTEFVRVDGG